MGSCALRSGMTANADRLLRKSASCSIRLRLLKLGSANFSTSKRDGLGARLGVAARYWFFETCSLSLNAKFMCGPLCDLTSPSDRCWRAIRQTMLSAPSTPSMAPALPAIFHTEHDWVKQNVQSTADLFVCPRQTFVVNGGRLGAVWGFGEVDRKREDGGEHHTLATSVRGSNDELEATKKTPRVVLVLRSTRSRHDTGLGGLRKVTDAQDETTGGDDAPVFFAAVRPLESIPRSGDMECS